MTEVKNMCGEVVISDTNSKERLDCKVRLALAKDEMCNPPKTNTAQVGKYSYRYEDLQSVIEVVRPALRSHDLDFEQGVLGDCLNTYIIDLATGTAYLADPRELFRTGEPQPDGSKETYNRRYALKTVFGLVGEDDDGKAGTDLLQPLRDAIKAKGGDMKALQIMVEGYIGKPVKEFNAEEVNKAVRYVQKTEVQE